MNNVYVGAPFIPESNSSEALIEHTVGIFEDKEELLEYIKVKLRDAALEHVLEYVEKEFELEDDVAIANGEKLLADDDWVYNFFRHHQGFFEDVKNFEEENK